MADWVKNLYQEEKDSSSDDELPEVVSTAEMKSVGEKEINRARDNKRKQQEMRKERKRLTMEKFLLEKKAKVKALIPESETSRLEVANLDEIEPLHKKPKKNPVKSYTKLNIKVQPLENISASRAKSAANFKINRLAKVSRESVSKGIISYNEKLKAKNT